MFEPPNKRPIYRRKATEAKRRKYIENVTIGGMSKKDAALAAGFSPHMAHGIRKIETPEVVATIQSLEKALLEGIPTELLVQKFAEGLDATVPKSVYQDGESDIREFPDYRTRLQYLEKIALISGRHEPRTRTEHTGKDGGPIELTAMTHEQLQQRKQWLERQLGIDAGGEATAGALPAAPAGGETG